MTIEKMNRKIERMQEQKTRLVAELDQKIDSMEKERDSAILAETQQVFVKHRISMNELYRITAANREQLKRILSYIGEQVDKPEKAENRRKDEKKDNVASGNADNGNNAVVSRNGNAGGSDNTGTRF